MHFELQKPDGTYGVTIRFAPDDPSELKASLEFTPAHKRIPTYQVDFYMMEVDGVWVPYGHTYKKDSEHKPAISFKQLAKPLCVLAQKFLDEQRCQATKE